MRSRSSCRHAASPLGRWLKAVSLTRHADVDHVGEIKVCFCSAAMVMVRSIIPEHAGALARVPPLPLHNDRPAHPPDGRPHFLAYSCSAQGAWCLVQMGCRSCGHLSDSRGEVAAGCRLCGSLNATKLASASVDNTRQVCDRVGSNRRCRECST